MTDHVDPAKLAQGYKADESKVRLHLIPSEFIFGLGRVLTFGAQKYAERNWEKGMLFSRLFGATMRHLWAWWMGEDKDPETGFPHLEHAAFGIMALQTLEARKMTQYDDRPGKSEKPTPRFLNQIQAYEAEHGPMPSEGDWCMTPRGWEKF